MDETTNFIDEAGSDLTEETLTAIDDDWNETVSAAEEETEAPEADPQEESEETDTEENEETEANPEDSEESEKEEPEKAEAEKADELFELKHLGETKQVTKDEMKALAQKGLDYDRIRAERDALKAEREQGNEFEQFVKELAEQQKTTPEELMENLRVRKMMLNDRSLTAAKAKEIVKAETEKRRAETDAENQRKESFKRFAEKHPDVKPEDIPKSVWDEVHGGADISDAYDRHVRAEETKQLAEKNKQLEEELKALKDNQKNAARSTGSRSKSRGANSKMSAFDAAWYDGT